MDTKIINNIKNVETKKKNRSKLDLHKLRLSLKYRPEIMKIVLKMRHCIKKKNRLLSKMKLQLKILNNKDKEVECIDSCTQTDIEVITTTKHVDIQTEIPQNEINSIDKNSKNSCKKKETENETNIGWNIGKDNDEKTVSIADQVKEVAQSALQQTGMVYVESAGMYYDYKTAAKGNSLFAEVEDKRQEMAKNLIQMKQTNSRLRREVANKQAELDALLHEKHTIWEQQAGAAAHYDRELIESYEDRITQLEELCERQRRELSRWFSKAADPAQHGWLPGVMDHLKSECASLRLSVTALGAAQLASAAQVRELRRKLALTASAAAAAAAPDPAAAHKDDIAVHEPKLQPRNIAPDDAKKKVSFN